MIKYIKKLIEKHPLLWEIFKFLLIGGTATIIDFFIMGLVLYIWDPSLYDFIFFKVFFSGVKPVVWATIVGTGLGFSISLIFNYFFSIIFVFNGKLNSTAHAKSKKGFLLFLFFALIGLVIHTAGMYIGYDILAINEWLVKVLLTIFVLIFNYITRKTIIFKKTPNMN